MALLQATVTQELADQFKAFCKAQPFSPKMSQVLQVILQEYMSTHARPQAGVIAVIETPVETSVSVIQPALSLVGETDKGGKKAIVSASKAA